MIMKTIKKRKFKMNKPEIKTLKELKKTNYKSESIKVELARNLKKLIASGKSSFIGILEKDASAHFCNFIDYFGCLFRIWPC